MTMKTTIENKLNAAFSPNFLEVKDESFMHASGPDAQSHFKVTIVTAAFAGERLLARHRAVNETLAVELAGSVHALALHTYTPDEWQARQNQAPKSPPCHGG